jgi:hypothetical protein
MATCCAPGCNEPLARDYVACPDHYFKIPAALRAALTAAWRNWRATETRDSEQAYQRARRRVIDFFEHGGRT